MNEKKEMNKEEFQKKKKEIIADVEKTIDENGTFIYMSRTEIDQVILMGGSSPMMSLLIASAMNRSEEVRKIVQIAVNSLDRVNEEFDNIKKIAEIFRSKSDTNALQELIAEFKKTVDCKTCKAKDTCEIYKYGKDCSSENSPLSMMERMIIEMGLTPKGQA